MQSRCTTWKLNAKRLRPAWRTTSRSWAMREHSIGIPTEADWPEIPLRDLCHLVSRGTAPTYVENSPVLAIGQRCIQNSGFDASNARPHDRRYKRVLWAAPGDVLLNSTGTGTIGRSCIFDKSNMFMVDSHVTVIRVDRTKAEPRWINALLRSRWGQRHLESHCYTGSTNQIELSRSELTWMSVPVPPYMEQRRIAEILDTLDSQISVTSRIIDKLQARAHGLIEDLLASTAAEKTPLGIHLTQPPKNGFSPKEVDEWTGLQAIGLGCLTPDGFQPRQLKNVPARDGRNKSALLNDGDLLMSRANTRDLVGLVGIYHDVGSPCIYPDLMMRLTPVETCRTAYLELLLRSNNSRRQIQGLAQGTSESMVKVSGASVRQLRLAIPALFEQDRILSIVDTVRLEIDAQKRERNGLIRLKDGLAEDLLTGRVRVSEAEAILENL
ncbi:restriction endonuclease subunit S [Nonomuraea cavernae]|uniref:restriction endonuclease subunit S n=1 Tax=Nonomuraea cavernae TaxID=2045107 RepID=UPI00340A7722